MKGRLTGTTGFDAGSYQRVHRVCCRVASQGLKGLKQGRLTGTTGFDAGSTGFDTGSPHRDYRV